MRAASQSDTERAVAQCETVGARFDHDGGGATAESRMGGPQRLSREIPPGDLQMTLGSHGPALFGSALQPASATGDEISIVAPSVTALVTEAATPTESVVAGVRLAPDRRAQGARGECGGADAVGHRVGGVAGAVDREGRRRGRGRCGEGGGEREQRDGLPRGPRGRGHSTQYGAADRFARRRKPDFSARRTDVRRIARSGGLVRALCSASRSARIASRRWSRLVRSRISTPSRLINRAG